MENMRKRTFAAVFRDEPKNGWEAKEAKIQRAVKSAGLYHSLKLL